MRVGAVVVLYNPDEHVRSNIDTYLPFVGRLVAVNNSTEVSSTVASLSAEANVDLIDMGGNRGIAAALNAGCRHLAKLGYDIVLTMDQDSRFPSEHSVEIFSAVKRLIVDYAIVGLNFNANVHGSGEITVPKYWLTSGNFLSLRAFERVGGFNEELFIDYVDIEFDHRLKKAGFKLCYLNNYSLIHKIGDPIPIRVFGKTFYAMNESPIRCYYRYRNSRYLYGTDKDFYRDKYLSELLVNIPKMLLFEPDKKRKIQMIRRGLIDGAHGVLGPYREEAE